VPEEITRYAEIVAEGFSEYDPVSEILRRVIESFFRRHRLLFSAVSENPTDRPF
jgi:hypothetical protein